MTSKSLSSKSAAGHSVSKEPLLNTLARTLGHAAGTLTQVATEISGKIANPQGEARPSENSAQRAGGSKSPRRAQTAQGKTKKVTAVRKLKPAAAKKAKKKQTSRTRPQKKKQK